MNKKKDILLEIPCPELLCGLCDDILCDPMQVHCSEDHMFCRSCLANYNKESCPSCLEPLDKTSFQLSKFVKRQISRLRTRCIYHSAGCPWEGLLEDCHSQSCQYQSIRCPNSHRGCPDFIKLMDIDKHRTQCLYELIACPNSSKQCHPFLRKDSANHDSTCSSFQCLFSQEGCPFVGTLQAVGRHCEEYCGKLHERIRQLELECNYMKQKLEQFEQQQNQNQNQQQQEHHHQQQHTDNKSIVETMMTDTKAASPQDAFMDSSTDSSMDEMALFHQMFNNSYLSVTTAESNGKNIYPNQPPTTMNDGIESEGNRSSTPPTIPLLANSTIQQSQSFKDDTGLSLTPLATSEEIQPPIPSPLPLPPTSLSISSSAATAPKRSSNGKIIRYSKNKQLAHGALRMSRQRSTSGSSLTTEAILHALHIANKSQQDEDVNMEPSAGVPPITMSTSSPTNGTNITLSKDTSNRHQSSSKSKTKSSPSLASAQSPMNATKNNNADGNPSSYSFKNLDDVTKFLEELPPIVEGSPFLSPNRHGRKYGTVKSKGNNISNFSDRSGKPKSTGGADGSNKRQQKTPTSNSNSNHNNKMTTTSSATEIANIKNDDGTSTASSRPMYVLASTLLSKHAQGH